MATIKKHKISRLRIP